MLSLMRKHASSWIIKFILGAVILAFIPFGYGIYQDRRDQEVANVNGLPIFLDEYNQAYNAMLDQMRRNFGNSLNEDTIKMLGVRKQAMDQLIDQKLLLSEAERLKVRVGEQELVDAIRDIEAFQTAGVFDSRRYEYLLNANRLSKETFEQKQKEAMIVDRVRNLITDGVQVSRPEALDWYKWNNAQIDIDYLSFLPDSYKGIELSVDEIKAYYEENIDSYNTEEQIKARYLRFDQKDYMKAVEVSEDEIQDYYDLNPDEFATPKTVEARHILFKVDPGADSEEIQNVRLKAEEVLKLAHAGKDFAELAKEHSEGPSASKGGFLGAFRRESMVKPFADKAFSMETGQISDPVKTRFGWHIIEVEKINEATTEPYEKAKPGIQRKVAAEKAKNLAYDDAETVFDSTFESDDLDRIADERKMKIYLTDFFTRKGPVKGVSSSSQFVSAAYALRDNEISEVQELLDSFSLIQVTDRKPVETAPYDSVKHKVRDDLLKVRQEEKARDEAKKILEVLKNGQAWQSVIAEHKLDPQTTGFFKRNASIPKIGYDRVVAEAAFKLNNEKRYPDDVISDQNGLYIIRYKGKQEPESAEFDKEQKTVTERLLQQKKFKAIENWLAQRREDSDIMMETAFVE